MYYQFPDLVFPDTIKVINLETLLEELNWSLSI